jgi:hypothetical protein
VEIFEHFHLKYRNILGRKEFVGEGIFEIG